MPHSVFLPPSNQEKIKQLAVTAEERAYKKPPASKGEYIQSIASFLDRVQKKYAQEPIQTAATCTALPSEENSARGRAPESVSPVMADPHSAVLNTFEERDVHQSPLVIPATPSSPSISGNPIPQNRLTATATPNQTVAPVVHENGQEFSIFAPRTVPSPQAPGYPTYRENPLAAATPVPGLSAPNVLGLNLSTDVLSEPIAGTTALPAAGELTTNIPRQEVTVSDPNAASSAPIPYLPLKADSRSAPQTSQPATVGARLDAPIPNVAYGHAQEELLIPIPACTHSHKPQSSKSKMVGVGDKANTLWRRQQAMRQKYLRAVLLTAHIAKHYLSALRNERDKRYFSRFDPQIAFALYEKMEENPTPLWLNENGIRNLEIYLDRWARRGLFEKAFSISNQIKQHLWTTIQRLKPRYEEVLFRVYRFISEYITEAERKGIHIRFRTVVQDCYEMFQAAIHEELFDDITHEEVMSMKPYLEENLIRFYLLNKTLIEQRQGGKIASRYRIAPEIEKEGQPLFLSGNQVSAEVVPAVQQGNPLINSKGALADGTIRKEETLRKDQI